MQLNSDRPRVNYLITLLGL